MDVLGNPIDEAGPIGEEERRDITSQRLRSLTRQAATTCWKPVSGYRPGLPVRQGW